MASRADELVRYGEKTEHIPGPETIHEHHNGTMCLWDRAAEIIHDLEVRIVELEAEHIPEPLRELVRVAVQLDDWEDPVDALNDFSLALQGLPPELLTACMDDEKNE
jgi:hypothetical protein